uniref:D-alanine--D-alanine ligase C-terminal domain-containing protein n=1 Tax=Aegilops tauschii subsp. strangulata TaxID=200361 RepID=A0A453AKY6_AEGTS
MNILPDSSLHHDLIFICCTRSEDALQKCKSCIEMTANTLGLEGFSRIDAFVNVHSGEVLLIEVNTVPGMTPSTVLIHQVSHTPLS